MIRNQKVINQEAIEQVVEDKELNTLTEQWCADLIQNGRNLRGDTAFLDRLEAMLDLAFQYPKQVEADSEHWEEHA